VADNAVERWFRTWATWPPRRPHEISKGPKDSDRKLGGHSDSFQWVTETSLSEYNISDLKLNRKFPSPLHTPQHRRQICLLLLAPFFIWLNVVAVGDLLAVNGR